MERKNGPWTIKKSENVYQDDFIKVVRDEVVQPDGDNGKYAIVELKQGVCTLAIDDAGDVYLTRQFRYALGAESLEVIAGGMDKDAPLENAKREVKEELGIEAGEWIDLGTAELDTSIVRSKTYFFVARKLKFGKPKQERTESIKPVKITFNEAVEKVLNGEIVHIPSCVLILKAKLKLESEISG